MSSALRIDAGFIVEGHGDVQAVPTVFRRVAERIYPSAIVVSPTPFRIPKGRLTRSGELERTVEFVSRTLSNRGVILITVDSDQDLRAFWVPAFGPGQLRLGQIFRLVLTSRRGSSSRGSSDPPSLSPDNAGCQRI